MLAQIACSAQRLRSVPVSTLRHQFRLGLRRVIDGAAAADVVEMRVEEAPGRALAQLAQRLEIFVVPVERAARGLRCFLGSELAPLPTEVEGCWATRVTLQVTPRLPRCADEGPIRDARTDNKVDNAVEHQRSNMATYTGHECDETTEGEKCTEDAKR